MADAMLWEPSLAEMGCDPMDDLGFPLTDSPLVFLNASAEAVSAFDFSELTGVLLSKNSFVECVYWFSRRRSGGTC